MSFRLFGVPVAIRGLFWLVTLLLGLTGALQGPLPLPVTLLLWVAVVLVSILVHEMGHALAMMQRGGRPAIVLHAMGGLTTDMARVRLSRGQSAFVSFAGPLAGLILGGVVYAASRALPPTSLIVEFAIAQLLWVNIGWSVINLMPVIPFDGGHILEDALGPRRARTAYLVSLIAAVILAGAFAWMRQSWATVLFLMAAMQSYQRWSLPEGGVLVDPFTSAPVGYGGGSSGGPSAFRKWWLNLKLKRLQNQADALKKERRAGGPPLRVIQGGAGGRPKDKRDLN